MGNAKALDKRRKSVRNIRKITRTMELIATAKFKKSLDRAHAATAYTHRMTQLVADLARSGLDVSHPLLEGRSETRNAKLLVISANRGLCGGYNSNVLRLAVRRLAELNDQVPSVTVEVAGKRGISAFKFRKIEIEEAFTHFDDSPAFEEVDVIATRYLEAYAAGQLDRLDVVYTKFKNVSKQVAVVETLLPLGDLQVDGAADKDSATVKQYEFLPSAAGILEEVVPTSFKIKLFKCFLDAAVSEQTSRMVAMKAATDAADDMIKDLSMTYNRARQGQITSELLDVVGGVEALK